MSTAFSPPPLPDTPAPMLVDLLHRAAPQRTVVQTPHGALTLDALAEHAASWAVHLIGLGIGPGDAVVVYVDDPLRLLPALFGTWQAGAAVVPLDHSRPPAEVLRATRESRAKMIIADTPLQPTPAVRVLPAQIPPRGRSRALPRSAPESPALLLYTSGTTGRPKCVIFSHRAMAHNVDAMTRAMGLSDDDIILVPMAPALPAVLATCVLPAAAVGARALIAARFIPSQTLRWMADQRATVLFAVPYIFELMYESPTATRLPLPSLRLCVTSSAALPVELARRWGERFGVAIRSSYCSSEAGAVTYNDAVDLERLTRSVGRALDGVRLTVQAGDGRTLPPGELGEVVVAGPQVASGYLHRPGLQRKVFRAGWIHTGDLGWLDPAGYLYLAGRLSETINVAGSLVSPLEVEDILRRHPAVRDSMVIGQPDPDAGEIVVARVVCRSPVTEQDLRAHCAHLLAAHKAPRRIEFVDTLPHGRMGKLLRRRARA